MIISSEKPPIYDKCCEVFGADNLEHAIFTYGDTVFNVQGDLSTQLLVHEEVHAKQQSKVGVENWWNKYLSSKTFRVNPEAEAYRAQYDYVKTHVQDGNKRAKILLTMSHQLSNLGDLSMAEATKLIYAN